MGAQLTDLLNQTRKMSGVFDEVQNRLAVLEERSKTSVPADRAGPMHPRAPGVFLLQPPRVPKFGEKPGLGGGPLMPSPLCRQMDPFVRG